MVVRIIVHEDIGTIGAGSESIHGHRIFAIANSIVYWLVISGAV